MSDLKKWPTLELLKRVFDSSIEGMKTNSSPKNLWNVFSFKKVCFNLSKDYESICTPAMTEAATESVL